MDLYCTRPGCRQPQNSFLDLDDVAVLKTFKQKYCMACGMPLLLEGRYLPINLLGAGGFGAAFGGRDRLTPKMRSCAIKQFKPAISLNAQQLQTAQELFHREAEVLEQLGADHPQIPDLFAFFELAVPQPNGGSEERFFYLIQEFIDGENLEQELGRRGPFTAAETMEVLTEMLKVLDFIHAHDVIHRDVKPSNIMRHRNGRLYLLDFGAIKNVTKPGSTIIYSQGYAPPEQLRGQQVFFSSDLYALAATCVLLLTGRLPEELFDSARNSWQWRQFVAVDDVLAGVLEKMLEAIPAARFQSAQEALAALFDHSQILQPPPSRGAIKSLRVSPIHRLPLLEYLGHVAFVGAQGGCLGLALHQLGWSLPLAWVAWVLGMGGLVYGQWRYCIQPYQLAIVVILTGVLVLLFLKPELDLFLVVVVGSIFVVVNTAILFRLVYRLLSRWG